MRDNDTDDRLVIKALIALVLFVVCLFAGTHVYNRISEPVLCSCGTHDSDIIEQTQGPIETAKRRIRKIWFAGGSPKGISEFQFQAECMDGLNYLSTFTSTDFVKVEKPNGAYLRVYVFSNEQFWERWADLRKSKTVPLERQTGNSLHFTDHPRILGWIPAAMVHGFGHRVGIRHSADLKSIMHPHLPVKTLIDADRLAFQRKLGKAN